MKYQRILRLFAKAGYAGVPNTLDDAPNCTFSAGDAAATLNALIQSLRVAAEG